MSGDLIGRPVNAVLVPPQAERFAALTGADPGRLVLNVTGWNKLVLLDAGRVFLFPRAASGVEWFERELAPYRALARTTLDARLRVSPCHLCGLSVHRALTDPFPLAAAGATATRLSSHPKQLRGKSPYESLSAHRFTGRPQGSE